MTDLLLLHGAIGSKEQFAHLSSGLSENFNVHTINFSGHGGEQIPDKFSIELFAQDVVKYLSTQSLKAVDIFGFSMGGYVALYLARFHPEKIRRIFTFATKMSWTPEIAARETKMLNPELILTTLPEFASVLQSRHSPQNWKTVLEKTAAMMTKMGDNNILGHFELEKINTPILIGIGDRDNMVSLEESIVTYSTLPNARLVVFPYTFHPFEKIDLIRLTIEIRNFFIIQP